MTAERRQDRRLLYCFSGTEELSALLSSGHHTTTQLGMAKITRRIVCIYQN